MSGHYPILQGQTKEAYAAERNKTPYPVSVPWSLVAEHEAQAQSNHGQTLTRLAERGGLSPLELWCVVHDRKWYDKGNMNEALAIEWLHTVEGVAWR